MITFIITIHHWNGPAVSLSQPNHVIDQKIKWLIHRESEHHHHQQITTMVVVNQLCYHICLVLQIQFFHQTTMNVAQTVAKLLLIKCIFHTQRNVATLVPPLWSTMNVKRGHRTVTVLLAGRLTEMILTMSFKWKLKNSKTIYNL